MKPIRVMVLVLLIVLHCVLHSTAALGGSTQHTGPSKFNNQELAGFAKSVEKFAAQHSAQVFLISRLGQAPDNLPKDIYYTHVAVAVYSETLTESGRRLLRYSIYNLYQDTKQRNHSTLAIDYPVDFFAGAHELKTTVIIPTERLQEALFKLIASGDYRKLHNPTYSLVSNPFNLEYQNCTEYVLDLLNSAIYKTLDTNQLKANAKAYFKPYKVKKNFLLAGLGSLFTDDYTLADHNGNIHTATFTTIQNYLQTYNLIKVAETLEWNKKQ